MAHHAHSDFDSEADDDPYFEYNKCHTHSKLDSKFAKLPKLQKIEISRFYTKKRMEAEIEVNIS